MLTVTLYTRKDCVPCDEARADLQALQASIPHRLVEVDIESDAVLNEKYAGMVPSIQAGPYSLKPPFDRRKLQMTLGAADDRRDQLERIGGESYEQRVERG